MSFQDLDLALIDDSPWQTRGAIDDESVRELANSIEQSGLLQPMVVRPTDNGRYELLAGHRRAHALRLLGRTKVSAQVRTATSDSEARELVVVENAQREGIHPLDEAIAINKLLETASPAEVAAKLGKTAAYVHGRLRLTKLIEPLRNCLRAGELTLSAALRIARLGEAAQKSAAKAVASKLDRSGWASPDRIEVDHAPVDWDDISSSVASLMLPLVQAAFPLDEDVAGVVACMKCPRRTGAQTTMFADGMRDEDRCTDGACFKKKASAHWKAVSKAHRKAGGEVLKAKATYKRGSTDAPILLPGWGQDSLRLDHGAPFVDLNDHVVAGGRSRAWSKVLKAVPEQELTLARNGNSVMRLYPKANAAAILKKAYPKEVIKPSASEQKFKAEEKKRRAQSKVDKKVFTKVAELAAAVVASGDAPKDSAALATVCVEYMSERTGVDVEGVPAEEALLQIMLKQMGGYVGKLSRADEKFAELLGIDVAAVEAEVVADSKPKKKAAKKKPRSRRAS